MGLVLREEILRAQLNEERKLVFAYYLVRLVFTGHRPSKMHLDFISQILASDKERLFYCSYLDQAQLALDGFNVVCENDLDQDSTEIISDLKGRKFLSKEESISLERLSVLWAQAELFLSTSICLAALDGVYSVEQARLISDYAHRLGFSAYRLSVLEREVFQALHKAGSALFSEQKQDLSPDEFSIPSREQIFQDPNGKKAEDLTLEIPQRADALQAAESSDECLNQIKVQKLWNSDLEIVTKIDGFDE